MYIFSKQYDLKTSLFHCVLHWINQYRPIKSLCIQTTTRVHVINAHAPVACFIETMIVATKVTTLGLFLQWRDSILFCLIEWSQRWMPKAQPYPCTLVPQASFSCLPYICRLYHNINISYLLSLTWELTEYIVCWSMYMPPGPRHVCNWKSFYDNSVGIYLRLFVFT